MKIIQHYWHKLTGKPEQREVATRELQAFYKMMAVLPNPDPILRKLGNRYKVYEDLLHDDQVGHAAEVIEMDVKAREIVLDDNGASQSHTDFIKDVMGLWDHESIVESSLRYRLFGYQPFELIWSPGNDWVITDIVGKPSDWFVYDIENRLRLRTKENPQGLPVNKWNFHVARNKPTYENPYGIAALGGCFWPVAFKKGGIKFWLRFVEKYGMPFLVGKQPRGSGTKATDHLLDMLEDMIQDAVAVIPDDSSVDVLEPGGRGASSDLFERHVRYHDQTIMKRIAGSTLVSDDGQGTGSYGLGKVHENTSGRVADAVGNVTLGVYNAAIKRLTLLNAENEPPPQVRFVEKKDLKNQADLDLKLRQNGVRFLKKYFMNTYDMDEDDFEMTTEQDAPPRPDDFSESTAGGGQAELDALIEAETSDPARFQAVLEPVINPLLNTLSEADNYEDALRMILEKYQDMDEAKATEMLERAIFVSEMWGRLSVQNDDPEE